MKANYLLLLILVAALTMGCIGNKTETGTKTLQNETSGNPSIQIPAGSEDMAGVESDLADIDTLMNDSNVDIQLSEITI